MAEPFHRVKSKLPPDFEDGEILIALAFYYGLLRYKEQKKLSGRMNIWDFVLFCIGKSRGWLSKVRAKEEAGELDPRPLPALPPPGAGGGGGAGGAGGADDDGDIALAVTHAQEYVCLRGAIMAVHETGAACTKARLREQLFQTPAAQVLWPTCTVYSDRWLGDKLKAHGFSWQLKDGKEVAVETPWLVQTRVHFCTSFISATSRGYTVIFTDESFIHEYISSRLSFFDRSMPPISKREKGRRLNITDAVTRHGPVPGARWTFVSGEKDEFAENVGENKKHYSFDARDIESAWLPIPFSECLFRYPCRILFDSHHPYSLQSGLR